MHKGKNTFKYAGMEWFKDSETDSQVKFKTEDSSFETTRNVPDIIWLAKNPLNQDSVLTKNDKLKVCFDAHIVYPTRARNMVYSLTDTTFNPYACFFLRYTPDSDFEVTYSKSQII